MRTVFLAKALLVVAFAMTLPTAATADPVVCNPDTAIPPNEGATGVQGFFQRLLAGSEKPQAFSGAVMDDPEPGCSLGLDTRPFAAELKRRARREAFK